MRRCVILFFGLAVAIGQLIVPTAACAQTRRALAQRINGVVRDTLGRALPGVEVTLQAADGHVVAKAQSDNR